MKGRKLIFTVVALLLAGIFILLFASFWDSSSQGEMEDTVSEESSDEEENDINKISGNDINEISGNNVGEPTEETEDEDTSVESLSESVFSDSEEISKEDWFVYGGKLYVKSGEDVYEKSGFPEAVQAVLQEEENKDYSADKGENRLVIESRYHFYIYDFETDCMEEYWTEYGHLDWKVYRDTLYFIEKTGDNKKLMAYDMASGNAEQIDTGEYEPAQFDIRSDGAVGMWGGKGEGDEKWEGMDYWKGETYYCFWEDGTAAYVADKDYKDGNFGWTVLRGFTKNGIILEREYPTSIGRTTTYLISKDGKIDRLANFNYFTGKWDNLKAIPEGRLIYEDDRIVAVDMTSGMVKTYDYDLSYTGELQWDIEVSEDMEFMGCRVEGDGIWGIWKLADEDLYKRAALMKESGDASVSFIKQELQLSDEQYETSIDYPQLSGMEDKEKEKRLNALIEKDVMRILEHDNPDDEWCFSATLNYEIKYSDNQIISILYKGSYGAILPGTGQPDTVMVTTIDMEEEKILSLEDVVADYNVLYDMLMSDKFENITRWEGRAGQYKISEEYSSAERLMKELKGDDEDIEWYIDDGHFVIVIFDGSTDYNEYAANLQDAKDFLKKDFWKKIT